MRLTSAASGAQALLECVLALIWLPDTTDFSADTDWNPWSVSEVLLSGQRRAS